MDLLQDIGGNTDRDFFRGMTTDRKANRRTQPVHLLRTEPTFSQLSLNLIDLGPASHDAQKWKG